MASSKLREAIVRHISKGGRLTVFDENPEGVVAVYNSSQAGRLFRVEFSEVGVRVLSSVAEDRFAYDEILEFDCEEPLMGSSGEFDVILKSGRRVRLCVSGRYDSMGVSGWPEVYGMHRLLTFIRFLHR
jgi:hypothetical protein